MPKRKQKSHTYNLYWGKPKFNRKINAFYKLSEHARKQMLVKALVSANDKFRRQFERTIGKKQAYQHSFKEQAITVNDALISGYMSARFRGKLGTEYKIIQMAQKGASASKILKYVKQSLGLKKVKTTLENQSLITNLVNQGIIYSGSTTKTRNSVRVLYFKDLTQSGKTVVIPDSLAQRMSIDDILIEFGRVSGKRQIDTDNIPIIYYDKKKR